MRQEIKSSCLKRLKRIEGQVRGLAGMVAYSAAKAALKKASGRYSRMGTLIDNVATAFAEESSSLVGSRMSVAVGNGMTTMGDMSAPPRSTTSQPVLV